MIEKEGIIEKVINNRTYLLRDNSDVRLDAGLPTANFLGTGLALVGITKPFENVNCFIGRINALKAYFNKEANNAIRLNKKGIK